MTGSHSQISGMGYSLRICISRTLRTTNPVSSEGDQPWDFFGRNDAKAETPVLWPPHAKSWLIGKDSDCWEGLGAGGEGDDRGWDGWMASLTQWTWVWVNSGSWWWTGGLACCDSRGRKESDTTERLNWTDWIQSVAFSLYDSLLPTHSSSHSPACLLVCSETRTSVEKWRLHIYIQPLSQLIF